MTKYAALYCRLSPRPDGSYEGVPAQAKWGRAYAAKTWPGMPVKVFADSGYTKERVRQILRAGGIEPEE